MKSVLRIVKYLAIGIYAVCGVMLLVFLVPKTGWKALNVATGSMRPAIPAGSLVVVHRVNPHAIKTGDVVTYINPVNTKETITHRVVQTTKVGAIPAFVTKGDANATPDRQILGGNVVGKVVWHAPDLGKILGYAKKPVGLVLLIIIPGILIITEEMRRLVEVMAKAKFQEPEPIMAIKPLATSPVKPLPTRSRPKGVVRLGVMALILVGFGVGVTKSQLTTSASLTRNTISVAATSSGHMVIQRVFLGGNGSTCPQINNSASIINTGPDSVNSIVITTNCHIVISNSNDVSVKNSSNQTSQSGGANSQHNTGTGGATSGSVSNSNNTSTTININNDDLGSSVNSTQWFELYNPTASSVNLGGWTITDNSGHSQTLPTITIHSHAIVIIKASALGGTIGDGLSGAGDDLVLKNASGANVDAVSWGSDTTQLNPAVPQIPAGGSIVRKSLGFDTNAASDWLVQGP